MSTPDRNTDQNTATGHIGHTQHATADLVARQAADTAIYHNATHPTRTTTVVSWIGWHITEIGGITVPALLGSLAWDGFYAVSALVALGWAANELRGRREQAKRRASRKTTASQEKPAPAGSDEDGEPA